ncbi:hypothetical protein AXW67_37680 [Bradyrhizobium neotropicale]|uniref:Uncharacterized protein n=2 Tax=Bradyrhizobium neotropicale TaxID=1497615 RepID=A0A176ZF57_9BRAD|nr:hypothetical protein AXW67_37680 [Bradyrhizobium neotropicale]
MSADKIAKDASVADRLYQLLATLSRAAAPITPEQIRITMALAGEPPASPEIGELAHRLRLIRTALVGLCLGLGLIALLCLGFAAFGKIVLGKASEIQNQLATLTTDWEKTALSIQSTTPPKLVASCALNSLPSDLVDLTERTHVFDLCVRTKDLFERRTSIDHLLGQWNLTRRRAVAFDPMTQVDVLRSAAIPPVNAAGAHQTIEGLVALVIPLLFGTLGAAAHALRSLARTAGLGRGTPIRILLAISLGALFGASTGPLLGSTSPYANAAVSFLLGYAAPQLFAWFDKIVEFVAAPSSAERDWTNLPFLRPVSRATHFGVGAILAVAFLSGCMLLPGAPPLPLSLPTGLETPQPSTAVIPFLTMIGGGLGAWVRVNSVIYSAITSHPLDADAPRAPVAVLRYVTGAFGGFIAAFWLPSSLLAQPTTIAVFNPFLLAGLSLAAGYAFARFEPIVLERSKSTFGAPAGASAVEEGVRRALAPPPLVNYKGYLNLILRTPDLERCMVGKDAILKSGQGQYVLETFFDALAPDDALSTRIHIDDGIDADEAPFDVEISADGFTPRRRRARIAAPRASRSNAEHLAYSIDPDLRPDEAPRFRVTVTQAGRVIQFASLGAKIES